MQDLSKSIKKFRINLKVVKRTGKTYRKNNNGGCFWKEIHGVMSGKLKISSFITLQVESVENISLLYWFFKRWILFHLLSDKSLKPSMVPSRPEDPSLTYDWIFSHGRDDLHTVKSLWLMSWSVSLVLSRFLTSHVYVLSPRLDCKFLKDKDSILFPAVFPHSKIKNSS